MRQFDVAMLGLGVFAAISWSVFSDHNGIKLSNSSIVAHSLMISSTIDGQIVNTPPDAGTPINTDDLLVRVHNGRIDRSLLINLDSQIDFLQREITNAGIQETELELSITSYKEQASTYTKWMLKDVQLKNLENAKQLEVAQKYKKLKTDGMKRASKLFKKQYTSSVNLEIAETEAEIASKEVDMRRAQLDRSRLLLKTLKYDGVFFEDGDTSYWEKMADSMQAKLIDTRNQIFTLNSQLARVKAQSAEEQSRIDSSFAEAHLAPFDGIVSASFVTKGTRVVAGTNLMEVLDCANPVVIAPLPDHRIGEFFVGMVATIYPIDSDQVISGTVKYISSGPLIGHDSSLQIQQDLTLGGVRAIIEFDQKTSFQRENKTCEPAHKALVVVHRKVLVNQI